jgi:hypothetical protein
LQRKTFMSINESELKSTNCKQYWKTIKMLIKDEGQSSEYPPLRSLNQNDASHLVTNVVGANCLIGIISIISCATTLMSVKVLEPRSSKSGNGMSSSCRPDMEQNQRM